MEEFPEFAYNNTYDVRFTSEMVYHEAMDNITKPDGCLALINECRQLSNVSDPSFSGSNQTVNEACQTAFDYCELVIFAFDALNDVRISRF